MRGAQLDSGQRAGLHPVHRLPDLLITGETERGSDPPEATHWVQTDSLGVMCHVTDQDLALGTLPANWGHEDNMTGFFKLL